MIDRLQSITSTLQYKKGQADTILRTLDSMQLQHASALAELQLLTDTKTLFDALGTANQTLIKQFIEPLITEALVYVFDFNIKFSLEFSIKRNQTEIDFMLTDATNNQVIGNLESTFGGGILDVVSIVLRIGLMHFLKVQGPLILDEPTKFVDEVHNSRVGQLLQLLSHKFNRQMIIITHSNQLAGFGDKIITVTQNNGRSSVQCS